MARTYRPFAKLLTLLLSTSNRQTGALASFCTLKCGRLIA